MNTCASKLLKPAAMSVLLFSLTISSAAVKISTGFIAEGTSTAAFAFTNVPAPAKSDAAASAEVTVLDGAVDGSSGGLSKLNDGALPTEPDEPEANFFLDAGTEGGRLQFDLGRAVEVKQVNSYSRHPNTRGPQVYQLYASDGEAKDFNAKPAKNADLEKAGWKLIAKVDTRPRGGTGGGQYGVSVSDSDGALGKFRYLVFDVERTEADDAFGNTFYSEIDVVGSSDAVAQTEAAPAGPFKIKTADGYCEITIDTSGEPELKEWAEQKLAPILVEWYPKITATLANGGFSAPTQFSITIKPGNGVAATGGTRITANSTWLKRELNREAIGALLHEEIHVVQQYGRGRRGNPDFKRPPGWLVEGIPDYIRWFLFEPQSHGADVVWLRTRRNLSLNYDGMYRITANFLNYVVEHYDKEKKLITKINAACRQGEYTDALWNELTGKPLADLNDEWKAATQKELAAKAETNPSQTPDVKQ